MHTGLLSLDALLLCMLSRGRYVLSGGTAGMTRPIKGDMGFTVRPVTLTSTPLQLDASQELLIVPSGLYQLIVTLAAVNCGRIAFMLLSTGVGTVLPAGLSQTTAVLAPHRVASAAAFQVKSIRPKSVIANNRVTKTVMTSANSMSVAPFCSTTELATIDSLTKPSYSTCRIVTLIAPKLKLGTTNGTAD